MPESKFNLEQLVEKYNSGVPIPTVEPPYMRATLALILRNRQAFPEISMGVGMEE
jgi:hypothetical protein